MELRGKDVLVPNGRGEALAVTRARADNLRVERLREKAVHEINVAAFGNAAQQRALRLDQFQLVPPDLRHLQPGPFLKTDHAPFEKPQARCATVEFIAALEE